MRGQERSPRGCSVARTGPRTPSDGHPTALPLRPRHSCPRPAGHPRSVPAHPGLPMAPEAGASPRPLPWAALLLLAALLPVASSAGPPGTHMRDSAVGRLSFPLLARLSLWGHCPALTLCSLGACLVTNLCILLGRVRTRWVWALDTARWSWASGHLQHERIGVPSTASWNFQESGDWNLSRCPGEQGKGKEK